MKFSTYSKFFFTKSLTWKVKFLISFTLSLKTTAPAVLLDEEVGGYFNYFKSFSDTFILSATLA